MCTRYSLAGVDLDALSAHYSVPQLGFQWKPSYNICPTDPALAIMVNRTGKREAAVLRWGLIPFWAKDTKIGVTMINARAESLATRPAFKEALEQRRCLIIADGFYEFQAEGKLKLPLRYTLADGQPFAFAGLWASWNGPSGPVRSCTIITTTPNELIAPVHDRMPVILSDEAERIWLDHGFQDVPTLLGVMSPFPGGSMKATPVSTAVNRVTNKGPECIAPR